MSTILPTIYNTNIEAYELAIQLCGSPNCEDFDRVFDECCELYDAAVDAADVHPPHPDNEPDLGDCIWGEPDPTEYPDIPF
jgi:hypothetical protein